MRVGWLMMIIILSLSVTCRSDPLATDDKHASGPGDQLGLVEDRDRKRVVELVTGPGDKCMLQSFIGQNGRRAV